MSLIEFDRVVKVALLRDNAKMPEKAHSSDAGFDFFYAPEEELVMGIKPGETKLLMTGVSVAVPCCFYLEIKNKSGVAYKKQLLVGACVVDSGYDGEVFVNLHNTGREIQFISPGEKIAQGILLPIYGELMEICSKEEVTKANSQNSSRGDGALGSTGDQ